MRKLILIIATIIMSCAAAYSAPTNKASFSGRWQDNFTWNLGRTPSAGDTVIIPLGRIVIIDSNEDLNAVYIKVYGVLKLVGGKLNLSPNSVIRVYSLGTILGTGSNSEQLKIGNDKIYTGSEPAIVGPQQASSSTSSSFEPFAEVLPVKFLGFSAVMKNKDVLVQWSTTEEVNAASFEVERSNDGTNWNTIGQVAAAGNSSSIVNYSFTDKNITSGTVYYRVKQVDIDGRFVFTPVRSIKPGTTNGANVNIASTGQSKVLLQFATEVKGTVTVRFISPAGQVLAQQTLNKPFGQVILNTPSQVKGGCIVSLTNGQDLNVSGKVIL
jgi:hypothetical protein